MTIGPPESRQHMINSFQHVRFSSPAAVFTMAALSGFILFLCIPTIDWWILAWIALVPVLLVVYDAPERMIAAGITFGFVAGIGKVYWITETVVTYGGLNLLLGLLSMSIVAMLVGVYSLVFCIYVARTQWKRALFPLLAASMWTALELLQSYLFTGFPWELLGYSQYKALPMIQIANFAGVYGVSFVVVLVNATIAQVTIAVRDGMAWRPVVYSMMLTCALFLGTAAYGFVTMAQIRSAERQIAPLKVAIVQGSVEQGLKWSESMVQTTVDTYDELTRKILPTAPDFIVFPETAMTFYLEALSYRKQANELYRLANDANAPILTGALGFRPDNRDIYNSAYMVGPGQGIVGKYSKMHLVPFGEYLPLSSLFWWLSGLSDDIGALTPGEFRSIMDVPGHDIRVGAVICYESIFPDEVRRFAASGANVLVIMTNDAWFGTSSAPMQHFSMAVLRAVESGVPVIRAANTGISGYISAMGQISGTTSLFERTTTSQVIKPGTDGVTFYAYYGDLFAYLCVLVAVCTLVWDSRRGRNENGTPS